ncbi:hypothetical protein ABZP36_031591 [Zizania latifolia]
MEFSLIGGGDAAMHQLLDLPDELERQELPSGAIVLAVDMPGVSPADVRVQVQEGNVLTISGERARRPADDGDCDGKAADGGDGVKCLRMERRMGKFIMRKFPLTDSADLSSTASAPSTRTACLPSPSTRSRRRSPRSRAWLRSRSAASPRACRRGEHMLDKRIIILECSCLAPIE